MPILTAKILTAGKQIISQAILGLTPALPHSFQVGTDFGFTPLVTDLTIRGSLVHTGYSSSISVNRIAEDTVRFVCNITETFGPFDVGNLVLFMEDTEGSVLPFMEIVLPVVVRKVQSSSSFTQDGYTVPGSRLAISIELTHSEDAIITSVNVITPTYASLPTFATEADVPIGAALTYKQYIVSYDTRTKGPVLGTVDADNTRWLMPFTHQISDPNFGHMDGGTDGEGYGGEPTEIIWGYYYLTPGSAFAVDPIGGSTYTGSVLQTIGGASYLPVVNQNNVEI